jgi:serine/threonine-protein kinase HipA
VNGHLDVFLRGHRIGVLSGASGRLSFQYDPIALDEDGSSSIALSLSLPVTRNNMDGPEVFSYFDGLLPLVGNRRGLAAQNNLSPSDTLGFLSVLGSNLGGAIKILPSGTHTHLAVPVLESVPEPIIKQHKAMELIPNLLISEEWALRVARTAGLPAAAAHLVADDELAVTRFDYTPDGKWLHQEDFGQALGLASQAMYEDNPSIPSRLTQLTALVCPHTEDATELRRGLLRVVTFNLLIGNGDAHSKNYSLLFHEDGQLVLAPMYDVAPTHLLFEASGLAGHALSGEKRLSALTLEHVVREGTAWGLEREDARATAVAVIQSVSQAATTEPVDDRISFLPELIATRAQDLLNGGTARGPMTESLQSPSEIFRHLFGHHPPPDAQNY